MTKGQRAMAVAMVYPEPIKIKRSGSVIITDPGVDPSYLSHARTVLQYAPDLADNILAGSSSLDEAYETAHVCVTYGDCNYRSSSKHCFL